MGFIINELFRFRMLMAGVYVGIAISSTYGFSVLTEHLKSKYNFSQSDITTISTVGNCVGYLSFFAGMLFDYGGPKVVFPLAGLLGFLGYLLFGLAMDDTIKLNPSEISKNTIYFSIFNAILYLGCPAMDVATLMPLMMNFPLERGYMVIIQKTLSGLGTSILMAYFNGFFRDINAKENSLYSGYVYFVGAEIMLCACLGAIFIDLPPYTMCAYRKKRVSEAEKKEREGTLKVFMSQHAPRRRLYIGVVLVLVNLVFLTISSVVIGYVQTTKGGYVAIAVLAIVLVALFALMALPLQFLGKYTPVERTHKKFSVIGWVSDETKGLATLGDASADGEGAVAAPLAPDLVEEGGNENTAGAVTSDEPIRRRASDDSSNEAAKQAKGVSRSGVVEELGNDGVDPEVPPEEQRAAIVRKKVRNSVGDPQYGGSFWRHLLTVDLWLLWLSFFGMWGTGTVMQMNSSQIYRSKNYGEFDAARNTLYIALIGVGSAIGRISSGVVDMHMQQLKLREDRRHAEEGDAYVPSKYFKYLLTTIFLPVGPLFLFIAYLLFAVVPAEGLIVPFLIGAIGTGAGWALGSLSIRIMYANDIGKHYNMMFSSGFICTITLNRFMFGEMYDSHARHQGTAPACNTPICVRDQMFILMAVNVVSTLTAATVHLRFQRFVMRKRKEAEELLDLEEIEFHLNTDGAADANNGGGNARMALTDGRQEEQQRPAEDPSTPFSPAERDETPAKDTTQQQGDEAQKVFTDDEQPAAKQT